MIALGVGAGAGGASANPGAPEPVQVSTAQPNSTAEQARPILDFVPETGSAGPYNSFMCMLHRILPAAPCMYT
ncbi:hypothetical protein D5S18_09625 [Nocardia panacis]|uniref:Uncharacterized protein n=2 Tax=Nocardia panacis TaxID=2340916 RepID=A0A3A4KSM2_9NOCA|nr:hypothetical protein D5S18_09625 [Nocardia panacis]